MVKVNKQDFPPIPADALIETDKNGVQSLVFGNYRIKGDYPGCDMTPPGMSERFGQLRRWHPRYTYLYYNDRGQYVSSVRIDPETVKYL